uniref:Uncharacterized protein n=1 Tax=Fibrocapsa japonica TaxID=94617 RepID=A0A7S2XZ39_9STRA
MNIFRMNSVIALCVMGSVSVVQGFHVNGIRMLQESLGNHIQVAPPTSSTRLYKYDRRGTIELCSDEETKGDGWWIFGSSEEFPYEGDEFNLCEPGHIDPEIEEIIQPGLEYFGAMVTLLATEDKPGDKCLRFFYHGRIEDKFGIRSALRTHMKTCWPECEDVVLETTRKKDLQDGGHIDGWVSVSQLPPAGTTPAEWHKVIPGFSWKNRDNRPKLLEEKIQEALNKKWPQKDAREIDLTFEQRDAKQIEAYHQMAAGQKKYKKRQAQRKLWHTTKESALPEEEPREKKNKAAWI